MADDTITIARARHKFTAQAGEYVVIVGGEVYVHPAKRLMLALTNAAEGREKFEAGVREAAAVDGELSSPMQNRLAAKAKSAEVIARCKAVFASVLREPGGRATDYLRLVREQAPDLKLKNDVLARMAIQRALHVLVRIQAIESDGGKHPAYRVS